MIEETSTLSLGDLAGQLPAADEALREQLFADAPTDLAERGATIGSDRVLVDERRLYAQAHAFWARAGASQQQALVGFSPDLLAVAVDEALRLERMASVQEAGIGRDQGQRDVHAAAYRTSWVASMAARRSAKEALLVAAGGNEARIAAVEAAEGTATDADAVVRALRAEAALAQLWLADPKLQVVMTKGARIDEAWIRSLVAQAAALEEATERAGLRMAARTVTQGSLDLADGRNLFLLARVIGVFDAAHERDPSVPRLIPISAARALGRRKPKETPPTTG